MHVDIPRVLVWPNQDIFKHGILAGFPASFGTAENLSKFLMYCRSKGKNGWPNVWYAFSNFELYITQISVIQSFGFLSANVSILYSNVLVCKIGVGVISKL